MLIQIGGLRPLKPCHNVAFGINTGAHATSTIDRGPSDRRGTLGSILALIAKRLGLGLVTLFAVSIIIFAAIEALPGNFVCRDCNMTF